MWNAVCCLSENICITVGKKTTSPAYPHLLNLAGKEKKKKKRCTSTVNSSSIEFILGQRYRNELSVQENNNLNKEMYTVCNLITRFVYILVDINKWNIIKFNFKCFASFFGTWQKRFWPKGFVTCPNWWFKNKGINLAYVEAHTYFLWFYHTLWSVH